MVDVPISTFLQGPYADTLSLSRTKGFYTERSISRVSVLTVCNTPVFDLCILMYLPDLKSLSLKYLRPMLSNPSTPGAPSFNLIHLGLSATTTLGGAALIVNLYKQRAAQAGVQAFSKLKELDYECKNFDGVIAFNQILEDDPLLESLFLTADEYENTPFPLNSVKLDAYLRRVPTSLSKLNIATQALPYGMAYAPSLSELIQFLSSIAATENEITHFGFDFDSKVLLPQLPPSALWSQIGALLADEHNFPHLESATFRLIFFTHNLLVDFSEGDFEGSNQYIAMAMPELNERVELEASVQFVVHVG